jgi:hypothetical protein
MDTTSYNREGKTTLFLPLLKVTNESDSDECSCLATPEMPDIKVVSGERISISIDDALFVADESCELDASNDTTGAARTSTEEELEESRQGKIDAATIYPANDHESDSDPWVRINNEIAEEPLVVHADNNHDVLSFEPDEVSVQNDALVERIFLEIGIELNKGRQNEYDLGKLLHRLHRERAKPGSGTFLRDVEVICHEWTISRSTIYRRINFFNAINRGTAELEDARLCHADKDAWPAESVNEEFDVEEKDAADALAIAQKKVIEETARRVAAKKADKSQRNPVKTIKLSGLSPRDRKDVHSAFGKLKNLLGDNDASAWVAHAILSHVQYLSTHTEAAIDTGAEGE